MPEHYNYLAGRCHSNGGLQCLGCVCMWRRPWTVERQNPVCRCRLTESGTSLDVQKRLTNPGMSGRSRFRRRHRLRAHTAVGALGRLHTPNNKLSFVTRPARGADNCHATLALQRRSSEGKLKLMNAWFAFERPVGRRYIPRWFGSKWRG
jgi:hypothetical protein